ALSSRHPHLPRRHRRGLELASALLGGGSAPAQGVTMRRRLLVPSLPGLTRQSILFVRTFREGGWMRGSSPRMTDWKAAAYLPAGASAALCLGAAAPLHAQTPASLPQGEGRELVATACSQCHTLSVIMAGRDGPIGWKRHVYNMVLRGAQLTPREADTVIAYLTPHFGPAAPPRPAAPAPNATPPPRGAGKDLVESRCVMCHNLERVTVVKRQKRDWERVVANMYERWGMSAPDEVNAISAYLVAQFGRD